MDLQSLEYAARTVFEMCRTHPEICPHDYGWRWSRELEDGTEEKHYECKLCGREYVVTE